MKWSIKDLKNKIKPKVVRFTNILLAVVFFAALMGSAFKMSFLFGSAFIVAFALAIYNGELKSKPWKPLAVFVGAIVIRFALDQYVDPILTSETIIDVSFSAVVFLALIIFGWKIKKS